MSAIRSGGDDRRNAEEADRPQSIALPERQAEHAAPAGGKAVDRAAGESGPAAAPNSAMPSDGERAATCSQRPGSDAAREPQALQRDQRQQQAPRPGPSRLSSRSAIQAPGAPIQLRTGPAAAVLSEGSVG